MSSDAEKYREAIEKIAALAIAVEIAGEFEKTADAKRILGRVSEFLLPYRHITKARKATQAATAGKETALRTVGQQKAEIASLMDELAKSHALSRGAVYTAAAGIPAAGIGAYMYGKKKGKQKGKEELIRELIGAG